MLGLLALDLNPPRAPRAGAKWTGRQRKAGTDSPSGVGLRSLGSHKVPSLWGSWGEGWEGSELISIPLPGLRAARREF